MPLQHDTFDSPVGELVLVHDEAGRLRRLSFADILDAPPADAPRGPAPEATRQALRDYFDGDLEALERIEVRDDGTAFQRAAWAALRAIPAGETRSYAQQAAAIGKPRATRAIGGANHNNPIAIVTPCHRVIGADGALTGYGGGLERKRWLLEHEGALHRR